MRALGFLAACAVAGAIAGRAFGAFARAGFHYPVRTEAASPWHRALLNALDVVEWPGLFALTLAVTLGLSAWLRPKTTTPAQSWLSSAILIGLFAAVAALIVVPMTNRPGAALAGVGAGLMGALAAALLLAFWRAAATGTRSARARWLSQLPLAAGHFAATSAAAVSLGYRGESALVHGIALLIGFGLFVVEVVLALLVAVLASRVPAPGDGDAVRSRVQSS